MWRVGEVEANELVGAARRNAVDLLSRYLSIPHFRSVGGSILSS
jgi:hypothetical protein